MLFVPVRLPGGPTTRPGPVQPPGARDRVAALLGPTRTRVLIAIVRGPRSTSDLARGLGISLSSASQHASVLRTTGLVATVRDGRRVVHTASELGRALVGPDPAAAGPIAQDPADG